MSGRGTGAVVREPGSTRRSASCTLTEKSVPVSIRPTDRFQMAISFCQPASGMPEASWWYPQLLWFPNHF